jgi:hypothetical protein
VVVVAVGIGGVVAVAMKPQTETVYRHLIRFGSITSLEALKRYGIARCAARILELKKAGANITKRLVPVRTRRGFSYVAKYEVAK